MKTKMNFSSEPPCITQIFDYNLKKIPPISAVIEIRHKRMEENFVSSKLIQNFILGRNNISKITKFSKNFWYSFLKIGIPIFQIFPHYVFKLLS